MVDRSIIYGIIVGMKDLYCPCRVRIPLRYNPLGLEKIGAEIEPELLVSIFEGFTRQFGGYTPLNTAEGDWNGMKEPTMGIEVAVLPSRTDEFREMVRSICRRLGQVEMYVEIGPPSVEFLKADDEAAAG
jgi:hypothetical protein